MSLNLLFVVPNPTDATSFYRAYGPFSSLRKSFREGLSIIPANNMTLNWSNLGMIDIAFMQRPFNDNHMQIAKIIKDNNIPLWVDYDDNLFQVPEDNPAYDVYAPEGIRKNIATITAMADVVTVSTKALKRELSKLNQNIRVVPNALNMSMLKRQEIDYAQQNNIMFWRGSSTHQRDIYCFHQEIVELAEKYKRWKWVFLGYNPWFVTMPTSPNQTIYYKGIDVIDYHKTIPKMLPAMMHVPLHENKFNDCKSNIAALEGIYFGSTMIVPDWDEWQIPGCLRYKNPKDYYELIEAGFKNEVNFEQQNKTAWEYVSENFTLEKINALREEILKEYSRKG